MDMRGSLTVQREFDRSLSLYSTNPDELGALGYRVDERSAGLLFALTLVRIQESRGAVELLTSEKVGC